MLLQDPLLDFVSPRVPNLTRRPSGVRFVGRRRELGRLLEINSAPTSECQLVLVSGAAGVGKSTLIEEFCRRVAGDGATVLTGRCAAEPLGDFQPISEILAAAFLRLDESVYAGLAPDLAALVPTIVPERDENDVRIAGADSELDRFRVFEAVASAIAAVPCESLVLVIADAHWADRATCALMRHLLRHPKLAHVRMVVTYRDDEITGERAELLDGLVSHAVASSASSSRGSTTTRSGHWSGPSRRPRPYPSCSG